MRNVRAASSIGLVVGLLALAPRVVWADLVTNGDFETGDFTGWTSTGNGGSSVDGPSLTLGNPHSGNWAAYFNTSGSDTVGIEQSISTTVGQSYSLNFFLKNLDNDAGTTPNSFALQIDGSSSGLSLTNAAPFDWTQYSLAFTATGANTTLGFEFQQVNSNYGLDDVSVNEIIPNIFSPVHSTLVMSSILFGMFGAVWSYNRLKTSTAAA